MRCPYCNTELTTNDYCSKCGKKVYAPGNPIEPSLTLNKKKSKVPSFLFMLLLLGIFACVVYVTMHSLNSEVNNYETPVDNKKELVSVLSEYGVPKYLSGDITLNEVLSENGVYQVLEELSTMYNFKNPKKEFRVSSEVSEGITYYRLEQLYNKVRVYGHELVMSVDGDGKVLSITGNYIPELDVKNYSSIKENEVLGIIKNDINEDVSVLSREMIVVPYDTGGILAYLVYVSNENNLIEYLIDASSGEIINKDDNLVFNIKYKYTGEGLDGSETIYLDEFQNVGVNKLRYRFRDNTRNIEIVDGSNLNVLSSNNNDVIIGDMVDGVLTINSEEYLTKEAISTMKAYEDIIDYYKNSLGRKSYDNKDGKLTVFININDIESDNLNAHYNKLTNQVFLGSYNGESLSSVKSILAHEFTHGVVSNISSLGENMYKLYKTSVENQSGALSEAYSDILGLIIESKSFVMAYGTPLESVIGRDLSNPSKYLRPDKVNGDNYYPSLGGKSVLKYLEDNNMESLYEMDNGGVHINSTVVGHAAYLSFKNDAYSSREEMAKVWYNSLYMLTPTSDFEDAALAVIKTAENLGLSERSVSIIRDAFYEVNILDSGSYKINGSVKSEGKGLSNVKVVVTNTNKPDIRYVKGTDKEGNFSVSDLVYGTYDITFSREGYTDVTRRIEIREDNTFDIELIRE